MSRLHEYRTALLATCPDVADEGLLGAIDVGGSQFASFIVDHGLGPQWHERTRRDEFYPSRMAAEALYLAQEQALNEIAAVLDSAEIEYVLIKGAANRLLLYGNPAIRACHDLDFLVRPSDRLRAATLISDLSFVAAPEARSIGRELVLTRRDICVDLHWTLLREGRLRFEVTSDMLSRRRKFGDLWILDAEDTLFTLLVHPAFTKHLAGWDMGLHRVMDIVEWIRTQDFDWNKVRERMQQNGVRTAGWAALRWVSLLIDPRMLPHLDEMMLSVRPGRIRRMWLDAWLKRNLSARTSNMHWVRLIGFTMFLHDTAGDSLRAIAGRLKARQRSDADIAVFQALCDQ